MNRQQRRIREKAKRRETEEDRLNNKIYSAILREKDNLRQSALEENIHDYCNIMAWVLMEEFKFGRGRIERFCNRFIRECSCLGTQHLNMDDIKEVLKSKDIRIR